MDMQGLRLFQAMDEKMGWLGQRQRVLAQNVANADTPDYIAQDLKTLRFQQALRQPQQQSAFRLAQTTGMHMNSTRPQGVYAGQGDRNVYEITPTGNTVTLEEQMMKVSETSENFRMTTKLYKKYTNMMKLAVRGAGG